MSLIAGKNDAISNATKGEGNHPGILETKAIAEEAFLFGLPIVMNYASMYELAIDRSSSNFKAPIGTIGNVTRVATYEDTAVITPNSDTPYSVLYLDLRTEPFVVSVPAVAPPRYYSVQLTDADTFNYGYIGSRTTGAHAGDYLIVGPDWKGDTPQGIQQVFQSSTQFTLVLFRTQLFNPADITEVEKIQAGYKAEPMSAYLKKPAPPAAPLIAFPKANAELAKTNFFEFLDFMLQFIPASPEEAEIRSKMASIGIGPGKAFDMKELSLLHKAEVLLGMKSGNDAVDKFIATGAKNINGWQVGSYFGDRASFSRNWLKRAGAAKGGLYGNDAAEAMYPNTRVLANGDKLDCSKYNYTLTFAKGQQPPVNAFWSVTMYDSKSQFLIKNPLNRYLINSPMLPDMKTNPDGSLTLYLQKDSPGADKEANWLPAPADTIFLVMRLYWPKDTPPSILPVGEGTWAPRPSHKRRSAIGLLVGGGDGAEDGGGGAAGGGAGRAEDGCGSVCAVRDAICRAAASGVVAR